MALEFQIRIDELLIKMNTNIPDTALKNVNFNRSMLHISEENKGEEKGLLNNLPWYTSDIEYPLEKLEKLSYMKRVNFFFNKNEFNKYLLNNTDIKDKIDKFEADRDISYKEMEELEDKEAKIAKKNIMTTLQLLFSTRFPVINNIHQSFNLIRRNDSTRPLFIDPLTLFGVSNTEYHFSHVNLGGKVFTFKKVTWLNDVLNNPLYQTLFMEYNKLIPAFNKVEYEIKKTLNKIEESQNPRIDNIKKLLEETEKRSRTKDIGSLQKNLNDSNDSNELIELIISFNNKKKEKNWMFFSKGNTPPEFKDVKDNMIKIIEEIIKENETYKVEKEKLQNLWSVFMNKDDNKEVLQKIPDELLTDVKNFEQKTVRQLKQPIRISSNSRLQNILDNKTINCTEDITLYSFLKHIYSIFNSENKNFGNYECAMDIGVTTDKPSIIGQSKKEIHVMCEFIGGEVSGLNVNKIYCPAIGDITGLKLEEMIEQDKDYTYWQVDTEPPLFNIETNETTNSLTPNKTIFPVSTKTLSQSSNENKEKEKDKQNKSAADNFQVKILVEHKKSIEENIERVRKYDPTMNIGINNLYDSFLSKYDTSIINLINKWNDNVDKKVSLLVEISNKKNLYESDTQSKQIVYNEKEKEGYLTVSEEQEFKKNIEINKLILNILDKLKEEEEKKQKLGGGKRKTVKRVRFLLSNKKRSFKKY